METYSPGPIGLEGLAPEAPKVETVITEPKKKPKKDEKEVLKECLKFYSEAARDRLTFEPTWMECQAFLEGNHYARYSELERRMVEDKRVPPWRVRVVHNRIRPAIDQMQAMLTADPPILGCRPASQDFEDQNVAKVGSQILSYLRNSLGLLELDSLLKRWKATTGTAALEVIWDKDAGEFLPIPVVDPMTGDPVIDPVTGEPIFEKDEFGETVYKPTGDIRVILRTSFELYTDPLATSLSDSRYIIIATLEDPEVVEATYGKKVPETIPTDPVTRGDNAPGTNRFRTLWNRVKKFFGGSAESRWGTGGFEQHGVEVLRIYLPPSNENPGGRMIICSGNAILYDDISPTRGKFRFPVFLFHHRKHGKRIQGSGAVQDCIDPQKEINRTISQAIEIRNLHAQPKWLLPKSCGITQTTLTSMPGEGILYDSMRGETPKILDPQDIPPSLINLLNTLFGEIDRIVGINEATRGEVPEGTKTGVALQVLKQGNTERLAPVIRDDNLAWKEVGSFLLYLVQQNWSPERVIKAIGRANEPYIKDFAKAFLSTPQDVIVENDSALPQDKVERVNYLNGIFQPGGVTSQPPEIQKKYFDLLGMADITRLMAEESADAAKARRRYRLCLEGVQQKADYFDDHAEQRRVLANLMKQPDFEKQSEEVKQIVYAFDQSHAMYLQGTMPTLPGGAPVGQGQMTPDQMSQIGQSMLVPGQGGSPPAPSPM